MTADCVDAGARTLGEGWREDLPFAFLEDPHGDAKVGCFPLDSVQARFLLGARKEGVAAECPPRIPKT
ncbi:UNVERIFIED_CONTAM: hypothetical protein Slati_2541200 [Sesamum latifolium]|uniref:Uncharacterized protein n=1 Tax=Sesamum latifolium TaxID=2727402 RepID=A0AAW2WJC7_9LAMI